jgi:hypothetical protein
VERTASVVVRDIAGVPISGAGVYYSTDGVEFTKAQTTGTQLYLGGLGDKVTLQIEHSTGTAVTEVTLPDSGKVEIDIMIDGSDVLTKVRPIAAEPPYTGPTAPAVLQGFLAVGPNGSDACASATPISGSGTFNFNTVGATTDGVAHPACTFFGNGQTFSDIWYSWTADCTGTTTLSLCGGATHDSKVVVYTGTSGCPPGNADVIACNDDFCGLQSQLTFPATNGTTYKIRLGGFGATDVGSGTFTLNCSGGGGGPTCANPVGCQLPDQQGHGGGGTLAATSDRNPAANFEVADNFEVTANGSITSVCWWGVYFDFGAGVDCGPGTGDSFQITYYNDDAGGSIPGSLKAGPFSVTPTKATTGNIVLFLAEWQFEATHAAVPVSAGECVWMEISNGTTATCFWLWDTAPAGDNRSAQSTAGVYAPTDFDLAFCVDVGITVDGCGAPPPPNNDDCANAVPISGTGNFPFDNTTATNVGPNHAACLFFGFDSIDHDVWFCWTAACTGNATVQTCGLTTVDTKIAVYDGCSCPPVDADLLACNDDACGLQSSLTFSATSGNSYLIRLGTFPGALGGTGQFNISCTTPVGNDFCADAIAVGVPSSTSGTTVGATIDTVPFCGTSTGTAPGVWYSVTGTGNTMTATTCNAGTAYDTKISVYCGNCANTAGLTCVAGNDDFCGLQSSVSWCSQSGATYLILVHGFGTATGAFQLDVSSNTVACTGAVACLATGACCVGVEQTQCIVATSAACAAQGGYYNGDGTVCSGYQVASCSSAFEDISASGNALALGDDTGQVVPLGFNFTFFGNTYTTIAVCSNGYLTFGATQTDFTNDPIPNTATPNDIICPIWDDYDPSSGGQVDYQTLGLVGNRRFIAQWTAVPQFSTADQNTFQAVLYENGNRIEFRYGTFTAEGFAGDYTVGIENITGTTGLSVLGSSIHPGDCVEFSLIASPCPPPECFLVVGQNAGNDVFSEIGHTWTTQVDGIFDNFVTWLDDTPAFQIPPYGQGSGGGMPSGHRRAHGMHQVVPIQHFAVQVLMWNPMFSPSNPERFTQALEVTVWSNGSVDFVPHGVNDAMTISHEITRVNGNYYLTFPFTIQGL